MILHRFTEQNLVCWWLVGGWWRSCKSWKSKEGYLQCLYIETIACRLFYPKSLIPLHIQYIRWRERAMFFKPMLGWPRCGCNDLATGLMIDGSSIAKSKGLQHGYNSHYNVRFTYLEFTIWNQDLKFGIYIRASASSYHSRIFSHMDSKTQLLTQTPRHQHQQRVSWYSQPPKFSSLQKIADTFRIVPKIYLWGSSSILNKLGFTI